MKTKKGRLKNQKDLVIPEAFIIEDGNKKPFKKIKSDELIAPSLPQFSEEKSPKKKDEAKDTVIIIDI